MDGRKREARVVEGARRELLAWVGGKPTVYQETIIERIVMLMLKVAMMDRELVRGGEFYDKDSREYLSWVNGVVRLMRELGPDQRPMRKSKPAAQDLTAYLASRRAAEAAGAD